MIFGQPDNIGSNIWAGPDPSGLVCRRPWYEICEGNLFIYDDVPKSDTPFYKLSSIEPYYFPAGAPAGSGYTKVEPTPTDWSEVEKDDSCVQRCD